MNNHIKEFAEIINECSKQNWDCYGANPITFKTLCEGIKACSLLHELGIYNFEIGASTRGEINFEFNKENDCLLVNIIDKTIHYGGIVNDKRVHGIIDTEIQEPPMEFVLLCKSLEHDTLE